MNFGYTPEQEALRRQVTAFIAEHVTPEVLEDKEAQDDVQRGGTGEPFGPHMRELYGKLRERGWLGIAYPREYGGQGGDRISQYIVEEAFMRVGLNISLSGSGAPAIMAAGTEAQKQYFIPRLISREITFALGFTEPHAGADLASIRCKAARDGDEFVINGQKIYTTSGHLSTHIYLMARTDPSAPKREGLSIFIFPLDLPGITVRPLWSIQNSPRAPLGTTYGEARTNETFFDNVRVHESTLLGAENKGWKVAADGLNLDRVGAFRYVMSVRRDEDIVNWVKETGLDGYANNPALRDKVAELWIEAQVCRLMTMRSMSIVQRGRDFTYEGAAEKVWAPEHGVRTTEAITQMLGPYGQLLRGSPHAVEDGVFAHNVLGAFQSGVNHGGVQIMRDQVARRGLGMPGPRRQKAASN